MFYVVVEISLKIFLPLCAPNPKDFVNLSDKITGILSIVHEVISQALSSINIGICGFGGGVEKRDEDGG